MDLKEQGVVKRPVIMYQNWEALLFLHWSVDAEVIQKTLPRGLTVDVYQGRAWIGVVPFFMSGVRPRFLPAVPGISSFQELNLRTYVMDRYGRKGVWFYSLDTSHRLPVWIARCFFHLNYVHCQMEAKRSESLIDYQAVRVIGGQCDELQRFTWQRIEGAHLAEPGSLEHFLVERYRLFAYNAKRERLLTGTIAHAPYQIQEVALKHYSTRLFQLNGFDVPQSEPESVVASAGASVRIYPLEVVR